jgi:hypothetical protein
VRAVDGSDCGWSVEVVSGRDRTSL